jgi:hypothetical protein
MQGDRRLGVGCQTFAEHAADVCARVWCHILLYWWPYIGWTEGRSVIGHIVRTNQPSDFRSTEQPACGFDISLNDSPSDQPVNHLFDVAPTDKPINQPTDIRRTDCMINCLTADLIINQAAEDVHLIGGHKRQKPDQSNRLSEQINSTKQNQPLE